MQPTSRVMICELICFVGNVIQGCACLVACPVLERRIYILHQSLGINLENVLFLFTSILVSELIT